MYKACPIEAVSYIQVFIPNVGFCACSDVTTSFLYAVFPPFLAKYKEMGGGGMAQDCTVLYHPTKKGLFHRVLSGKSKTHHIITKSMNLNHKH